MAKPLAGKTFCFSGRLNIPRAIIQHRVEKAGGDCRSSVSKRLSYLVIANPRSNSIKAKKARDLGIKLISESYLLNMMLKPQRKLLIKKRSKKKKVAVNKNKSAEPVDLVLSKILESDRHIISNPDGVARSTADEIIDILGPKKYTAKSNMGWGVTLGGALATAIGLALKQKHIGSDVQTVAAPEHVEVQQMRV